MKLKNSIAVITINKDCSKDLVKTIRSVDSQDLQPNIHLIVAKKLEVTLINKFNSHVNQPKQNPFMNNPMVANNPNFSLKDISPPASEVDDEKKESLKIDIP